MAQNYGSNKQAAINRVLFEGDGKFVKRAYNPANIATRFVKGMPVKMTATGIAPVLTSDITAVIIGHVEIGNNNVLDTNNYPYYNSNSNAPTILTRYRQVMRGLATVAITQGDKIAITGATEHTDGAYVCQIAIAAADDVLYGIANTSAAIGELAEVGVF